MPWRLHDRLGHPLVGYPGLDDLLMDHTAAGGGEIELFLPESGSLKEKRFILESLKKRIHQKFNVSISEVGDTEKWQRATFGVALVSNESKFIDKVFSKIINFIEIDGRVEVINYSTDIM